MLTLGLPGTMFVEVLIPAGRKLPPDSAWPLALLITQVGALIIVPVSLALRFAMPHAVGWHHAWSIGWWIDDPLRVGRFLHVRCSKVLTKGTRYGRRRFT
jgi:hypothetical protein